MRKTKEVQFAPSRNFYVVSSLGFLLAGLPVLLALYSPDPRLFGWLFFAGISVGFLLMTFCGFWFAATSKIIVGPESFVYKGLFRKRSVSIKDIKAVNVWGGNIAVITKSGKNFSIPAVFSGQHKIALVVQEMVLRSSSSYKTGNDG